MTVAAVANAWSSVPGRFVQALPVPPDRLVYLDEWDDSPRAIEASMTSAVWPLSWDTHDYTVEWHRIDDAVTQRLLRIYLAWQLRNRSPATACARARTAIQFFSAHGAQWFHEAFTRSPLQWAHYWDLHLRRSLTESDAHFVKSLLDFFRVFRFGTWRRCHAELVRSLTFPWSPEAAAALVGATVLTPDEEMKIIAALDKIGDAVSADLDVDETTLIEHCLLCLSYTQGLRPVQMARLPHEDILIRMDEDGKVIVQFIAHRAKKRRGVDRRPFMRSIPDRWAPPFVALRRRVLGRVALEGRRPTRSDKAIPRTLPQIGTFLADVLTRVVGRRRTATDLRHNAAARLADAGASIEDLMHFLGHSSRGTAQVYFEASAAHARITNRAVSGSAVLSAIGRTARTATIRRVRLSDAPPDRQVGGASGIGVCWCGILNCRFVPEVDCYQCVNFTPVDDVGVHRAARLRLGPVPPLVHLIARLDEETEYGQAAHG
jgi:integrase